MEQEIKYYERIPKKSDNPLPFNYNASKTRQQPQCIPRWHEEIEVKYILSGTAEFICGTEVIIAGAGDIIVTNPCELHGMKTYGSDCVTYHLLMVSAELPLLRADAQATMPRFKHLIKGDPILADNLELLFREITEMSPAYELSALGALALVFSRLKRCHAIPESVDTRENRRIVERIKPALDHIVRHYAEDISIQELAQLCTMSVYHFCRVFKNETGISPRRWMEYEGDI